MFSTYRFIFMKIKIIFIWNVLHEDSFWNRGTRKDFSLTFKNIPSCLQNLNSFYKTNTLSCRQVMRKKNIINQGILSWYNTKFSKLTSREMYENLLGELRSVVILQPTSDMAQHWMWLLFCNEVFSFTISWPFTDQTYRYVPAHVAISPWGKYIHNTCSIKFVIL